MPLMPLLIGGILHGQTAHIRNRVQSQSEIRGASLTPQGRLLTWGTQLVEWTLPSLTPKILVQGDFSEGGCLADLDNDGQAEFVSKEGSGLGKLTWRKPPYTEPVTIHTGADTHDCLEATLFGRKGILTIHRHMQVRFYERSSAGDWTHREIYSIYTPSQQSGLSVKDIDGDGRADIVCGNYWIQSPDSFELPWRIFAINTYSEQPLSAMLVHAFAQGDLFAAQAHMQEARAALFHKPPDPKQLWVEKRVGEDLQLHRVHGVAVHEGNLFFAENNGPASRTFTLRDGRAEKILDGIDVLKLFSTGDGMLSAGPRELVLWNYPRK